MTVDRETKATGELGGFIIGADVGVDVGLARFVAVKTGEAEDAVRNNGGFVAYCSGAIAVVGDMADEFVESRMLEEIEHGWWIEVVGEVDEMFELVSVNLDAVVGGVVDVGREVVVLCEVGTAVGLENVTHEADIGAVGGVEAGTFRNRLVSECVEQVELKICGAEEGRTRGDKLGAVGALPVGFVGRRMIAGGAGFRFMFAMLTHKITPL